MTRYDPDQSPPRDWLSLDEQERILLVQRYHQRAKVKLPNATLHAVIHTVVENQLADGLVPVVETFERLQREGLDRHDAIHCVGSVLAPHLVDLMKATQSTADPTQAYYHALRELTALAWRRQASR